MASKVKASVALLTASATALVAGSAHAAPPFVMSHSYVYMGPPTPDQVAIENVLIAALALTLIVLFGMALALYVVPVTRASAKPARGREIAR